MFALIVSFFIWAVVHSLTAAQFFKNGVRHLIGEELYQQTYRFFYTGFSTVSFLPNPPNPCNANKTHDHG